MTDERISDWEAKSGMEVEMPEPAKPDIVVVDDGTGNAKEVKVYGRRNILSSSGEGVKRVGGSSFDKVEIIDKSVKP